MTLTFVYTFVTGLKEVPRTSTVKSLDVKMYKANTAKYGVIHFVSLLPGFQKLAFSQSSPQNFTWRALRPWRAWTEKHWTWPAPFPTVACHGQGQDDVLYVKVENKQQALRLWFLFGRGVGIYLVDPKSHGAICMEWGSTSNIFWPQNCINVELRSTASGDTEEFQPRLHCVCYCIR